MNNFANEMNEKTIKEALPKGDRETLECKYIYKLFKD